MNQSRRKFLGQAALWLTGASLADTLLPLDAQAALKYKVGPWRGDDFTMGHKMRNGEVPDFPRKVEAQLDFVIVGGGLSALTAAHKLKNHNYLLLEQYPQLGGQARGENHNGLWYSLAAAYFVDLEGAVGRLCDEFGLKPVSIGPEKNSYLWQNKWFNGIKGAESNVLYKNFKALESDIKPIMDRCASTGLDIPVADSELLRLDGIKYSDLLTGYDAQFKEIMTACISSSACGSVDTVSALAGANLVADFFNTSYVFPGGNPALARALEEEIRDSGAERLKTGAFVWHVEIGDNSAEVVYSDASGMHRVKCRHVIITTPPLVSGRILANVKNSAKANLFWFRYGSYLVANVMLKERLFKGPYDNFTTLPYPFADITVAETPYVKNGTYKAEMGQILTVYQPFAPGTAGRSLLLEGDRTKLAADILEPLNKLVPMAGKIDQVVLSRWGHAIAVPYPQYYSRINQILANTGDSYSLAHSSLYGMQCLEAAVQAGTKAAQRALRGKS
jgi:protoporphyrinogen oxidase